MFDSTKLTYPCLKYSEAISKYAEVSYQLNQNSLTLIFFIQDKFSRDRVDLITNARYVPLIAFFI